jgi:hypothetical protein
MTEHAGKKFSSGALLWFTFGHARKVTKILIGIGGVVAEPSI